MNMQIDLHIRKSTFYTTKFLPLLLMYNFQTERLQLQWMDEFISVNYENEIYLLNSFHSKEEVLRTIDKIRREYQFHEDVVKLLKH